MYLAIAAPPLLAGAVNRTTAFEFPAVALTPVTTLGFPAGVTAVDAGDATDVPAELVAVDVKVYATPSVSPEITQDVDGE